MGGVKRFMERVNGISQLSIKEPEDLKRILKINESYWMATSAPLEGLNCDPGFLSFVDSDGNGRIRTDELKEAIDWLFRILSDYSGITGGSDTLKLSAVNAGSTAGQEILSSARRVLKNLGINEGRTISLAQIRDQAAIMDNYAANGDGIIPPEAVADSGLSTFIKDVLSLTGGVEDAGGVMGIGREQLELFMKEAAAYVDWYEQPLKDGSAASPILFAGRKTEEAYRIFAEIEPLLDSYFDHCRLLNFNSSLAEELNRPAAKESPEPTLTGLLEKSLLAQPSKEQALKLSAPINPLYEELFSRFKSSLFLPLLGNLKSLSYSDWLSIKEHCRPYREWLQAKRGEQAAPLGYDKLKSYLKSSYSTTLYGYMDEDRAIIEEIGRIKEVERLILYRKWLFTLANNMVSMPNLMSPTNRCLFERGTLIMGGKQYNLCIKVEDRQKHLEEARKTGMFLIYLEVTTAGEERMEIVVPVTGGDPDSIYEGKRGVFYTFDGREWDARILEVVKNPISLWEAIKTPFVSLGKAVERQVEKISISRYSELETQVNMRLEELPLTKLKRETKQIESEQPSGGGSSTSGIRDLLLGGGVAFAALGSTFAFITKSLSTVKAGQILGVLLGIVSAVFLPTIFLGILRLRRRDLATILEASGWATNMKIRLSYRVRRKFTFTPELESGPFPGSDEQERVYFEIDRSGRKAGRGGWLKAFFYILSALLIGGLLFTAGYWWRGFTTLQ